MSTLMSSVGKWGWAVRVTVVLAVLALIATTLAVVPAFGTHVPPPGHPHFSDLPNDGVLRLHLDNDGDYFEYQSWNGTDYGTVGDPAPQTIGSPIRCELKNGVVVDGPLAAIESVDGHNVGLVDDNGGIRKRGSRGTPCGQVDLSEGALSVSLADGGPLDGKVMDYAEIDIEGKHDVAVSIQAYLGDVEVGTLQEAFNCETDTDCGPDSVDLDNFRVVVAVSGQPGAGIADVVVPSVFDRLDFVVTSTEGGEFSLGGGSDGTEPGPLGDFLETTDSLFHITNVIALDCDVETPLGTAGGPQGTIFLSGCGDADGKSVLFTASADDNSVTITNTGDGIAGSYTLEFWTFLPVPPTSTLSYDDDNGEFLAQFCLTDPRNSPSTVPNNLTASDLEDVFPLNLQTVADDDRHTTCVIEDNRTAVGVPGGPAEIRADFVLFSNGDAFRKFK